MTPGTRRWPGARELFDDPAADAATALVSLGDIARANRLLGGRAAALRRLDELLGDVPAGSRVTLLDVGTGSGDIPRAARRLAERRGIALRLVGVERHPAAARLAAQGGALAVIRADASRLPLRDGSADFVLCSQLLHHYPDAGAAPVVSELTRVARAAVVVADLLPSRLAALGFWLASFPLRFHPVTRRDGVTSVRRGFTPEALARVCAAAGVTAEVRTHPGYRVTAAWRAGGASR